MPDTDAPFVAMLGGTETFGKYVCTPYPALVAEWTGLPVMNLGVAQAGLSLLSDDPWLVDTASRAEVTVLQVLGAQNMSNRLYSVHSRRNDRFLGASPALREMFPGVEFTEIHFTGHLLSTLAAASRPAFEVLVDELRYAWVQRMRRIAGLLRTEVQLVWISDRDTRDDTHVCEPLLVDQAMLEAVSDCVSGIVKVVLPRESTLDGKHFPTGEEGAARRLPGPAAHARIAEALAKSIADVTGVPDRAARTVRATGS